MTDVVAIREEWVGRQFARESFPVTRDDMLDWAEACGETDSRFIDPDHPDFQAHPASPPTWSRAASCLRASPKSRGEASTVANR